MNQSNHPPRHRRCGGLSLPELLISLAISAALLVATMVAVDTSFRAYADATEQASTQAATRMVINRLLMLIRTSTAHGPLMPNPLANPPVTLNGNMITSSFIELVAPNNDILRIEYRPNDQELWLLTTPPATDPLNPPPTESEPIMGGVTNAQFFATRRENNQGIWVLERGTVDLSVMPDDDATLDLEQRKASERRTATPIRVIASTKPRKIE